jgi:hypothetical protein
VTPDPATGTAVQRAALAQGLVDLAALITAHPDAPIVSFGGVHTDFTYWPQGTADYKRAEVDRVAAILGQSAHYEAYGALYVTERNFGLVSYRAVALLRENKPDAGRTAA